MFKTYQADKNGKARTHGIDWHRVEERIRESLGACLGASTAALSEVEASLRFPDYLEGIRAELPGMTAEDALVSWAIRRGGVWRPEGRTDCRREANGPR